MKKISLFILYIAISGLLTACGGAVSHEAEKELEQAEVIHVKTWHTQTPAETEASETPAAPSTEAPDTTPAETESTEPPTSSEEETTEAPTTPEETTEALPQGFVWEDDKLYYYAEPGVRFTGWLLTEEGYSYFNEERLEGLQTLDGALYYFPEGILAFGHQTVDGQSYFFDKISGKAVTLGWIHEDGHARYLGENGFLTGTHVIDGVTCVFSADGIYLQGVVDGILYNQGQKLIGYVTYDGAYYFTDGDGRVQTGLQKVNGGWYYFLADGRNAEGFVRDPSGECYYANDTGWLDSGFNEADGKLYYFNPSGTHAMLRNTTVGMYSIDANGVCHNTFGEINEGNLDAYIETLLNTYGWSPRAIYDYVANNYAYKRIAWDTERNMAIRMFNTGYGACYDYCTITAMMLNRAGYRTQWVTGELHHYWLLVEMSPGVWRHMDTMRRHFGIYNFTDDQMDALDGTYGVNFKWDHSQWTSTTTTGKGDGPKASQTTAAPTTEAPTTTAEPVTEAPTTAEPVTEAPTTTAEPVTEVPPTTAEPATEAPTTAEPATEAPASEEKSSTAGGV